MIVHKFLSTLIRLSKGWGDWEVCSRIRTHCLWPISFAFACQPISSNYSLPSALAGSPPSSPSPWGTPRPPTPSQPLLKYISEDMIHNYNRFFLWDILLVFLIYCTFVCFHNIIYSPIPQLLFSVLLQLLSLLCGWSELETTMCRLVLSTSGLLRWSLQKE